MDIPPNAYLRSTLEEIWDKDPDALHETCTHRFRSPLDMAQNIFLWWQWCKGQIVPQDIRKMSKYILVSSEDEILTDMISNQRKPILILNDTDHVDVEHKKQVINGALDAILGKNAALKNNQQNESPCGFSRMGFVFRNRIPVPTDQWYS